MYHHKLRRILSTGHFKIIQRLSSSRCQPFPIIEESLLGRGLELTNAKEESEKLLLQLDKINEICYAGGGEKGHLLHVKKNKKVAPRERLEQLLDKDGDVLELSLQAGIGLDYGDIPGASSIVVIGQIHGRYCLITINDGTVKGGTYFPITVEKNSRSQEISRLNGIPGICLVDSGGGFLPLQADLFPDKKHGGRAFYNEAVFSSMGIPQLAMVCGSCTAGGAYVPMMSEEAGIVHKIGTIYLGGPPLVKAATGEVVSAEDLGGATMHCSISGCTDYFASTESEGFEMLRDNVATFDIAESCEFKETKPLYSIDDLDILCGLEVLDREIMLGIISRLVDGSRLREYKQRYGSSLIAGYSFIQGNRVGILANMGPLSYQDSLKGSHFIQICQHRNIPLVFLQNSGPVIPHSEYYRSLNAEELGLCLRAKGSMAATVATVTIPKISINVNGCHGDDNYTMCGSSFDPNFNFAWPGSEVSHTMNPPPCPAEESPSQEPKKRRSMSAFNFPPTSSMYQATRVLNDGIIKPSDTRKVVSQCLRIFDQKRRSKFIEKESSVLRF